MFWNYDGTKISCAGFFFGIVMLNECSAYCQVFDMTLFLSLPLSLPPTHSRWQSFEESQEGRAVGLGFSGRFGGRRSSPRPLLLGQPPAPKSDGRRDDHRPRRLPERRQELHHQRHLKEQEGGRFGHARQDQTFSGSGSGCVCML